MPGSLSPLPKDTHEPHRGSFRTVRLLFAFVFLLCLHTTLAGRGWNYPHIALPFPTPFFDMLEDDDGYIWLLGNNELHRYDGYEFTTITAGAEQLDETIVDLEKDDSGRIWCLLPSGKLFFLRNDTIVAFAGNRALSLLTGRALENIYIGQNDTLWLSDTYHTGLIKCWADTAAPSGYRQVQRTDTSIIRIIPIGNSRWVALHNARYPDMRHATLTWQNGTCTIQAPALHRTAYLAPSNVLERKSGRMILSLGKILIEFDRNGITACEESLSASHFQNLYEDREGELWGTTSFGVYRFSGDGIGSGPPQHLFPNRFLDNMFQDRTGNYWFSAKNFGALLIPSLHIQSCTFPGQPGTTTPSTYNNIPRPTSLVSLHVQGKALWAADLKGNVYRIDSTFTPKKVLDGNLLSRIDYGETVDFAVEYHSRTVWMGRSIHIVSLATDQVQHLPNSGSVKCYLTLQDGRVAVGTHSGFRIYRGATCTYSSADDNFTLRVPSLYQHDDGRLWAMTAGGVYEYDGNTLSFAGEKDSLLKREVIAADQSGPDGFFALASDTSLYLMHKDSVHALGSAEQIPNQITCLTIQNDSTLWLGSKNGLVCIRVSGWSPFTYTVRRWTQANGLAGNVVFAVKEFGGYIWLAGDAGLTRLDPEDLPVNINPPALHIRKILVNDQPVDINADHSLTHDQNTITVAYVGLSFRPPGNVWYRYRLLGKHADTGWKKTRETSLQFLALPAGEYTLQIAAANEDGVWNQQPAEVHFSIAPYFTETWWFLTLSFSAVPVLLLLTYWRISRNQRREQATEAQIRELRQKMLAANMNPHFIFNSLSSIQDYINKHSLEEANEFLARFGSLIRMNMLAAQTSYVTLEDELHRLQLYLSLEELRFNDRFAHNISMTSAIEPADIVIPTMLIQPYVENAIWHGILPLKKPGHIEIGIAADNDETFTIRIQDNGAGLSSASGSSGSGHTSLSMKLNRERLALLSRSTGLTFNVEATEQRDHRGNITGTLVELTLPLALPLSMLRQYS